jgi:hypothetical protein
MIGNKYTVDWSALQESDWRIRVRPASTRAPEVARGEADDRARRLRAASARAAGGREPHQDDGRRAAARLGLRRTLAYASLLEDGYSVRLSGQDSGRGTFFHRHAVLHDQQSPASAYIPLQHIAERQPAFRVIDSVLSEEAVMGFEYGYSTTEPGALVIWEGQFGDFANGAQVIIDQFISSGESKWGRLSGLVLFLPHGYEGQGPEHSSARLERFLQLCAENNMQVCVPSTPAQMFHMLRRQMLRTLRKPLIVMTPKSLLRHELSVSKLEELSRGSFENVIDEVEQIAPDNKVRRVVFSSGKVYFDLLKARARRRPRRCRAGAHRAALSVPDGRVRGGAESLHDRARDRLVPGRAAEPGRLVPDPPPARSAARSEARTAVRRSPARRGAGHGHRQDPRRRTGGADRRRAARAGPRRIGARHAAPRQRGAGGQDTTPGNFCQEAFMSIEIRVPQLPESVADATLVAWRKQPGEAVTRDENLADLETDKVVLEVPAPANGILRELRVQTGATVKSGDVLAIVDEGAAPAKAAAPAVEGRLPAQRLPLQPLRLLPAVPPSSARRRDAWSKRTRSTRPRCRRPARKGA